MGTISIRRGLDWFGSALPLIVLIDGNVVGSVPKGSTCVVQDFEGKLEVQVMLDGCKSRPLIIILFPKERMTLKYQLPGFPLLCALLERDAFGELVPDR